MKKRTIIYIFIIFIFALLSFVQWKCEFNMTFKMFKEVIKNTYFIEQWRYLTYANSKVFILVYPIIITYFGLKDFFLTYHSGMLYSITERTDYKSYIKNTFLNIYKNNSWVYFSFIFLMLLICRILFKTGETTLLFVGYGRVNYIIFALTSAVLSIFYSIFILNIGLITSRYCKKFSVMIIVSYLSFISFAIVSEMIIGSVFDSIIKFDIYNSFSIFNMIILDGNIYAVIIYAFVLLLLSGFIVFKIYKDKDKVLMEYE